MGLAGTAKDAEDYKKADIENQNLQNEITEMSTLIAKNPRGGYPWSTDRTRINALKESLITRLNGLAGLNRLTEQEVSLFGKQLDQVGATVTLNPDRGIAQLEEIQKQINGQVQARNRNFLHMYTPTSIGGRRAGQ
jgi:hypothetical protein